MVPLKVVVWCFQLHNNAIFNKMGNYSVKVINAELFCLFSVSRASCWRYLWCAEQETWTRVWGVPSSRNTYFRRQGFPPCKRVIRYVWSELTTTTRLPNDVHNMVHNMFFSISHVALVVLHSTNQNTLFKTKFLKGQIDICPTFYSTVCIRQEARTISMPEMTQKLCHVLKVMTICTRQGFHVTTSPMPDFGHHS